MAHASNFTIPARFNFRPYKASWVTCWAETVGWWEEPDRDTFFRPLAKRIGGPPPKSGDKVLVNIHVPSATMKPANTLGLSEMPGLEGLYGSTPPYTVEIDRTDIPPEVLQPRENIENTPDIAGREFVVLACPMPEFEKLFSLLKPDGPAKDAWEMQREFFDMEQDVSMLRRFLNRWGLWNGQRGYDAGYLGLSPPPEGMARMIHPRLGFALVIPHLLWEQREKYKSALAGKPRAWLGKSSHLSFNTIIEPPYFLVERSYCQDAIEATITIDHLSNVEFGICKRDDCRKLYERTTQQQRLYCSPECAHLANVRKLRAAKKMAQSKRKGAKQNAKR
jgi:hypothetical protein